MIVNDLNLESNTFWSAKANFFSLLVGIAKRIEAEQSINPIETRTSLMDFAATPNEVYVSAAREAVNNKKERMTRHNYVAALLKG